MAQSDLIILTFSGRDDAFWARRALDMMRAQQAFGLEHATEVMRDAAGQTFLHCRMRLPFHYHGDSVGLANLLSAAIFGPLHEDRLSRLTEAGLDEFLVRRVGEALVPNSSALLIYVPHDSDKIDQYALLGAVTLLKGTLYRTSIPEGIEHALLAHAKLL